jgi:hypothetical protein
MNHYVAKGIFQSGGSGNTMTWWKTNFNMPIPQIYDGVWDDAGETGPLAYNGNATSFDLSGFSPGYEVVAFFCLWHWDGPVSGITYLYSQWRNYDDELMFNCANGFAVNLNISPGYWSGYIWGCNQGVCGWEIDANGDYVVRSWATGAGAISTKNTTITFSNVPDTTELASSKAGYIWVEGNNLCYICANLWKHTIVGTDLGAVGTGYKGALWIDTSNLLHWVGNDGHNYVVKWAIQQFASTWSGSATGEVNAGTSKKGYIWVDNEYGWTHLSYIGYNGYKWLVGAGNNPYTAPS